MRGYNKAVIMGNLARDPDVRYTSNNNAVATFAVAVNRQMKDANGEMKEEVTFINIVAWGKTAENCQRYLHKGSGVLVEGRIASRTYEKDGQKRTSFEIVADMVQFVGGGRSDDQNTQQSYQQNAPQAQPMQNVQPAQQNFQQYGKQQAYNQNQGQSRNNAGNDVWGSEPIPF